MFDIDWQLGGTIVPPYYDTTNWFFKTEADKLLTLLLRVFNGVIHWALRVILYKKEQCLWTSPIDVLLEDTSAKLAIM